MDKPLCRICSTRHYSHEAHKFPAEPKQAVELPPLVPDQKAYLDEIADTVPVDSSVVIGGPTKNCLVCAASFTGPDKVCATCRRDADTLGKPPHLLNEDSKERTAEIVTEMARAVMSVVGGKSDADLPFDALAFCIVAWDAAQVVLARDGCCPTCGHRRTLTGAERQRRYREKQK